VHDETHRPKNEGRKEVRRRTQTEEKKGVRCGEKRGDCADSGLTGGRADRFSEYFTSSTKNYPERRN